MPSTYTNNFAVNRPYLIFVAGYGFLSESGHFAESLLNANVTWVGPPPEVLHLFGDKIKAREFAEQYNVPVVRGSGNLYSSDECLDVLTGGTVRLPAIMKVSDMRITNVTFQ